MGGDNLDWGTLQPSNRNVILCMPKYSRLKWHVSNGQAWTMQEDNDPKHSRNSTIEWLKNVENQGQKSSPQPDGETFREMCMNTRL